MADPTAENLSNLLAHARAHGQITETRQWTDDLERMLAVAWDLMTPEQRASFCTHADVLAIAEAAGGSTSAT